MLSKTARHRLFRLLLCAFAAGSPLAAQNTVGWLRYAIPPDPPRYHGLPHAVVLLGNNAGQAAPEEITAAEELDRGLGHMVAGTDVVLHHFDPRIDAIVLGTTEALHRARIGRSLPGWTEKPLPEEGFRIVHLRRGVREWYILQGGSPRAELWAAFRFAALVAEDQQLPEDFTDTPRLPLRAIDLGRAADALPLLEGLVSHTGLVRLLASVGINGLFLDASAEQAARVADAVQPYGMRVWMRGTGNNPEELARLAATPNFGGTILTSGLADTSEQLRVTAQMVNAQARVLRRGGASVLLDGALGPPLRSLSTSSRTPVELSPEDRAATLRGLLEPNTVLMGAASVEPLSGLGSANFGLLPALPQVAAFDLLVRRPDTLAYPAGAWASLLQTPEHGVRGDTVLSTLLAAGNEGVARGGVAGRLSAIDARQMLQQPLLLANLYAFGRLAWSPLLKPETLTDEWSRQTWGDDARVHGVVTHILLESTDAIVGNSIPLGLPLLASPTGAPEPEMALRLYTGQFPLATGSTIGTDRSAQGTNEVARYPAAFAAMLASASRCPTPWLLLFHRLAYNAALPNGRTVAQAFYDAHFAGAAKAGNAADAWEGTQGLIDAARFSTVEAFLARAAVHAEIWRETTTEWVQQISGIRDTFGFVGSHTGRVLAKDMRLSGYVVDGAARPDAGTQRIFCGSKECTAATVFQGGENVYRIEVGYEEEHLGCTFQVLVNGKVRAAWQESSAASTTAPERFAVNGVHLQNGDTVAVHVTTTNKAGAPLDFVEITRDPRWN